MIFIKQCIILLIFLGECIHCCIFICEIQPILFKKLHRMGPIKCYSPCELKQWACFSVQIVSTGNLSIAHRGVHVRFGAFCYGFGITMNDLVHDDGFVANGFPAVFHDGMCCMEQKLTSYIQFNRLILFWKYIPYFYRVNWN